MENIYVIIAFLVILLLLIILFNPAERLKSNNRSLLQRIIGRKFNMIDSNQSAYTYAMFEKGLDESYNFVVGSNGSSEVFTGQAFQEKTDGFKLYRNVIVDGVAQREFLEALLKSDGTIRVKEYSEQMPTRYYILS